MTHLKVCGDWKVVAARISGSIDLFNICSTPNCQTPDVSIYTPSSSSSKSSYSARKGGGKKTHSRSYSECGVMGGSGQVTDWLEIRPLCSHRAHQQPITCLEVEQDTILTGQFCTRLFWGIAEKGIKGKVIALKKNFGGLIAPGGPYCPSWGP